MCERGLGSRNEYNLPRKIVYASHRLAESLRPVRGETATPICGRRAELALARRGRGTNGCGASDTSSGRRTIAELEAQQALALQVVASVAAATGFVGAEVGLV